MMTLYCHNRIPTAQKSCYVCVILLMKLGSPHYEEEGSNPQESNERSEKTYSRKVLLEENEK